MIETRKQYAFSVEEYFIEWCTEGPWFNEIFVRTYMAPYLRIFLPLPIKIDTTYCVAYRPTTKKLIIQLMQQALVVEETYQKVLQHILSFIFASVLTS